MINQVFLVGNLGADVETFTINESTVKGKIRLATNRSYKDSSGEWKKITMWHTVIFWNPTKEKLQRLKKGAIVFVDGEINYREYVDKAGIKKELCEIQAKQLSVIGGNNGGGNYDNSIPASAIPLKQEIPNLQEQVSKELETSVPVEVDPDMGKLFEDLPF